MLRAGTEHEYAASQLKDLIGYMGINVVKSGFLQSPTTLKSWSRPIYSAIAATPGLRRYSPVNYILGKLPDPKPTGELGAPPVSMWEEALSIES